MPEKRSERHFDYIDFSKGLFQKGFDLLKIDDPDDDYSIISGCILVSVGLEKLIKGSLAKANPLMNLVKIEFCDVNTFYQGKEIENRPTISLYVAYCRLLKTYPKLPDQTSIITNVNKDRNFLVHNAGIIDIADIEKRFRVNVTEISEHICNVCLDLKPEELFGQNRWNDLKNYRDSYLNDVALKYHERIKFFKRLYKNGEKLPTSGIDAEKIWDEIDMDCPICGYSGVLGIALDYEYIYEDGYGGEKQYHPFFKYFYCEQCKFTITDDDDLIGLFGGVKDMNSELGAYIINERDFYD